MKAPDGGPEIEPDITINGVVLNFAEAMTVRMGLTQFQIYLADPAVAKVLGATGANYRANLDRLVAYMMRNQG